jgi:alkyl sulfatase BDS1-like metallo-beta-lactamase superfamily hydrolase
MNAGARLDEVLHTVRPPAALADRPYLQPVYDEPEFVVRNIWRLYGGWWDGNPATLKPAAEVKVAHEVVGLAGPEALIERATTLLQRGDDEALRLAAQLAEWLTLNRPDSAAAHELRAEVYTARVRAERSTMAKGVFGWAVRESAG